MAAPVWPSVLPQAMPLASYLEMLPAIVIRTKMDAGPAKVRRRFSDNVRPLKFELRLNASQYAELATFYQNDCAGGAIAFTWNIQDPELVMLYPAKVVDTANGIVQFTMRFVSPPKRSILAGAVPTQAPQSLSQVDLDLEVMI